MKPRAAAVIAASALAVAVVLSARPGSSAPALRAASADELPTASPAAQESEVYTLRGDRVALYNLAGRVELARGSGPGVRVTVRRGGEDADRLSVSTGEIDGRQTLRVRYPDDRVVYEEGRGSATLQVRDDGTFGHEGGDDVRVDDGGRGLRAHADLTVEVPEGTSLEVRLGLGGVTSTDVSGKTLLDVASGSVTVDGHRGGLEIDTGSGSVRASAVEGGLLVDTGSGSVDVDGVRGGLEIDTGSGSIRARGVRGGRIALDTGSGDIDGRELSASELEADTGSGDISLQGVSAPRLALDTGSGSVRLGLLSDVDDLEIDTGSGSVDLSLPGDFGSGLEVETGSGGVDLTGVEASRLEMHDGDVSGVLGDGDGETRIDTGSGGVTIRRSGS